MDRKKYPNLWKYSNHVDLSGGGGQLLDIDWELLPLEEEAYELEQLIKEQESERDKKETAETGRAALQEKIKEFKQKLPEQPALLDPKSDEFILRHLGETALGDIRKTRRIIQNKKKGTAFKISCDLEAIDESTFRRHRKKYKDYL